MKPIFIAEVKTRSPFGFRSDRSWDELFDVAVQHGDVLSIHTHPLWGGKVQDVAEARRRTKKLIVAKGVHSQDDDIKQALDHGANYVLVVGRLPHYNLLHKCLVEPTSVAQMREFAVDIDRMVWNSRDLYTGELKTERWEDAIPYCSQLIQASNIKSWADVKKDAFAFIVGEHLINFCK